MGAGRNVLRPYTGAEDRFIGYAADGRYRPCRYTWEGPFADAQATGTDMGRDGLVIRVLSSVVSELAAGGKATASP